MKDKIIELSNRMVRLRRVVNSYDQSIVGVVRSTSNDTFEFNLNNESKLRTMKYANIKNVTDLTDNYD